MFDHVLVPLDLSELAEKALRYAPQMVNPDGQLTLLTVIIVTEAPVFVGDIHLDFAGHIPRLERVEKDQRQRAQDYLNHVADRLARPNLNLNTLVQSGLPAAVIVDTAQRLEVQAIVMSTHGRTGLSRWLYGSVTRKVLDAAHCPVLVIPGRARHREAQE